MADDSRPLLIVANSRRNDGQTSDRSAVYQWNVAGEQFNLVQFVATSGASAVRSLTVHSVIYVVVFAHGVDSASEIKFVLSRVYFATFPRVFSHCWLDVMEGHPTCQKYGTRLLQRFLLEAYRGSGLTWGNRPVQQSESSVVKSR